MNAAGAAEIEKYPSGDYDPFVVAEKVFRAMTALKAKSSKRKRTAKRTARA